MKWCYLAVAIFWGLISAVLAFLMVVDFKWLDLIILPFTTMTSISAFFKYKNGGNE